jgi:ribosomal protein S18 acetylase RimI-like enzyme
MSEWTAEKIRAAAEAWVWVPPDAEQVVTSEYQLIAYPAHYQYPTQVAWSSAARPVDVVVDEVLAQARAWGRNRVCWWVRDDAVGAAQGSIGGASASQASTEEVLQLRGGKLTETVQVLAYDLSDGLPDLDVADGPQAELVQDERTLRASHRVAAEVWEDDRERTPAAITGELAGLLEAQESWSDFRVVVFVDGEPAAGGGCGIVGQVARLWGAGTRPAFRGRGAYRALLAARIALAREHGATLALVKGRVETSGPILRRGGFTAYGEERSYCVPVMED